MKFKALEVRRALASGQLAEEQPQLAILLGWLLNFCAGMIMSCAVVLNGCGPFGIAMVAQSGAKVGGLFCTLGASIGYLLSFGFDRGIKYVAAVVLVFTASYVFQELKFYHRAWFMPILAGAFTLFSGFLGAVEGVSSVPVFLSALLETLLAGSCTYFFAEAFSKEERNTESAEMRHTVSVIIALSAVITALARVKIGSILSIGNIAGCLIVMTAAYKGGALSGVAAGAALGIAMDLAAGGTPYFAASYSFSGLVSGLFSRQHRLAFVISYVLSNAASVVWLWSSGLLIRGMYDVFAATVIFVLLPTSFLNCVGAFLRPSHLSSGEAGLRRYTAKRIEKMSEAFLDLYRTVDASLGVDDNDEDISKIFNNASECVCSQCQNKTECWNKNYMDTLSVFNDLTPIIREQGLVTQRDLPDYFSEHCKYPRELISAINGELRGRMYRRQFKNRLAENRSAAYSQYADFSELLKEISEELRNAYGPDILAQRRLTRFLSGLDIEADNAVFRDRSGRLHILMESAGLQKLVRSPGYLDTLSGVVGARLCRQKSESEGEGRMTLLEAEPLSASVGIASMKKKGERVSGDRGTYFKTDRGLLCVVLSDGMGSGSDAARESVAAVRILERFLRAGVDPAAAMRMLNSLMLLKNGEEWGFATVDLMCIDLFTGETGFYKYGAAPSYVRSGKSVRRVRSESLAAGLTAGEQATPDVVRMCLKPGNIALIASDGVIAGSNDSWLREILSQANDKDTKILARETLQTALKQYGCCDDMTVLAVRIDSRE